MGRALRTHEPASAVSISDIEHALKIVAYAVIRHGPVYAPLLDRLESELTKARIQQDPVFRARRLLEAYTVDVTAKAIR